MMWASERGQLLARTVRGMMMYQQALELFEPLETADPREKLSPEFYEAKVRCALALMSACQFSREPSARMELLMWASQRGQLLACTVRGMMMCQQALELFEPLKAADPREKLSPELYEAKFRCAFALSSACQFSREPRAHGAMMWASECGQLLARTVRGMMMYQQALELV
jgi:hypothetical protein